jgi:hypothetical protein
MLAALRDDPRKVEKWGKWASGLEGKGAQAARFMGGASFLGGAEKILGMRQGRPQITSPQGWSPPMAVTMPSDISFDPDKNLIAGTLLGLGGYADMNEYLLSNYREAITLFSAAGSQTNGGKMYADLLRHQFNLKAGAKAVEGIGTVLTILDLVDINRNIAASELPPGAKLGAWTTEFATAVGSTVADTAIVSGGTAVGTALGNPVAGAAGGVVVAAGLNMAADAGKDNFLKKRGWNYK